MTVLSVGYTSSTKQIIDVQMFNNWLSSRFRLNNVWKWEKTSCSTVKSESDTTIRSVKLGHCMSVLSFLHDDHKDGLRFFFETEKKMKKIKSMEIRELC